MFRAKTLFALAGVLCLIGGLWLYLTQPPAATVSFQILKGTPAIEIARNLKDENLVRHPASFLFWVKVFGTKGIRPGRYSFSTRASSLSYYRQMQKGPPLVRITFPEGWMAKQMAELLEKQGICSSADFLASVMQNKREGYLFPDTYYFDQGTSAERVVARLVSRFQEKVPADFVERAKAMKLTELQLVTMASIIEREARMAQELPLISGVFHNRLRKRWYLESCATVEYALGAWKPRLLYKDLNVVSPYNTYRHPGLPPGPICNPGAAALDAAAHPADTDMMYFVADGQGTHRFSRYYKDHLNAKRKR